MTITKQAAAAARLYSSIEHVPLRAGRQLAAARALACMSQCELALLGGWNPRTVRQWEKADGLPTSHVPHLEQLLEIFTERGVAFSRLPLGVYLKNAPDGGRVHHRIG